MISENLSKLRKKHTYTQEYVAEKIGVTRQAVAKWESGESLPDLEKCKSLALLYDISIDDLVNLGTEEKGQHHMPKGKHIFGTVTIGSKGQIVIPKRAREVFNLKPGDEIVLLGDEEKQGIALMKTEDMLRELDFLAELLKKRGETDE